MKVITESAIQTSHTVSIPMRTNFSSVGTLAVDYPLPERLGDGVGFPGTAEHPGIIEARGGLWQGMQTAIALQLGTAAAASVVYYLWCLVR
jgi:hypothetical protein